MLRHVTVVLALSCLLVPSSRSVARKADPVAELAPSTPVSAVAPATSAVKGAHALFGTGVLASWDFEIPPDGWVSVDRTVQRAFMHIDSGSGQKPPALVGTKSVWCGTIVCSPTETCPWASPPGYGNNWNQVFQSTPFNVNGDVSVSYAVKYDLEASYDFAYLEYAGANNVWHTLHTFTGTGFTNPVNDIIPGANYTGPLRIRFRVQTDGSGSDEDGLYPSNGALQIDNLVAHAGPTTLCNETFESEVAGDLTTTDGLWSAAAQPAAGDYAGIFNGASVLQEDPGYTNTTKLRGFFNGSPDNYACGGHPTQAVVPFGSYVDGLPKFVQNEIQSPTVSLAGLTATEPVVLGFDMYADLPQDNLVFIYYGVRSRVSGNFNKWRYSNILYYQPAKAWLTFGHDLRPLIDSGASDIQVAIGVRDMCALLCGSEGTGNCHSHGPLIDNVRITQANTPLGNVSIPLSDPSGNPVSVTFNNVTSAGLTSLTASGSGPGLPAHFLLGNSIYYNITTTCTFTGFIDISIAYDETALTVPENALRLLHWDRSTAQWVDITTSLNTAANVINGRTTSLSPFVIGAGSVTAVGDTPHGFALNQNIPNPFNPTTTITYNVANGGADVTIAIYDATGRLVRMLVDSRQAAGQHDAVWDGRDNSGSAVSSGVYFYRMRSGTFSDSRRMVLLK